MAVAASRVVRHLHETHRVAHQKMLQAKNQPLRNLLGWVALRIRRPIGHPLSAVLGVEDGDVMAMFSRRR